MCSKSNSNIFYSIFLKLPVTLPGDNLNIVVNTKCTEDDKCNYAYYKGNNNFFNEDASTTIATIGGGVQLVN